jgi:hydroxymethylglutaryl-CoA synthase
MEPIREGLFELGGDGSGYLLASMCEACGIGFFPRRSKCVSCLTSDNLKDIKLSKEGRLYTYTTVYRPSFLNAPYMVGYVDFEKEGIRVFAQLTGCNPEDLEIGMEMELLFEEMDVNVEDKRKLVYKFRPMKFKER